MEACTGLFGDERQQCLLVFGVDAERVDTFYSTVYNLEMALAQDTGEHAARITACRSLAACSALTQRRLVMCVRF
jgi:hypothetical protein